MVQSTHQVAIGADEVVKRYVGWERGQPDREWLSLTLLRTYAPGLAPEPRERRRDNGRPAIVMSRLPGHPLGDTELTPAQVAGLGSAMQRLYRSIPANELRGLPERAWGPVAMLGRVSAWLGEDRAAIGRDVDDCLARAMAWLLMLLPGSPAHDRNPAGTLDRQVERTLRLLR